ncbi:MAG: phenylacetate--CoA ligase family protein [Candidatus Auribacter fodinae]|jgi:phenylacetate-CoA ligase|uniref:Phenylacetate--CoA ligase family protein n=1 Tax=Candidatus Auribacter fodinae TaxID=2093366 RepID=A0A3A4R5X3_9BACT|nr:MAG: phenylacetate--CoA ligase family protein [Candidatus Auribacter fodinae]
MNIFETIQNIAYQCIGDKRYSYYKRLKNNLSLSRDEMVSLQNRLIGKLIVHAYHHTRYYRELMDSLHLKPEDISCKEDLKKLPLLSKSTIRDNFNALKSDDRFGNKLFEMTSGGSTGNQAHICKSPYFNQYSKAALLRNNYITGWEPRDKSVWLWGAPYEHQKLEDSLVSRIGIIVNRRLLFNAYNYSPDDFPVWYEKILRFRPKIIFGYATIILDFAKYLKANNLLIPNISHVVSTTETLRERDLIAEVFKCPVYDFYGCREINGVGVEFPPGTMRIADDVVALNIYENGEFVITALHSYGFPLINYRLGDKGSAIEESTLKNDSLPLSALTLTIGRTTDNFINSSGRYISSSALSTYISTFKINVGEQQIIQKNYKTFVIHYVPDEGFSEKKYSDVITKALEEYFGSPLDLTITRVDKIPLEKSGKKLMFKRMFLND